MAFFDKLRKSLAKTRESFTHTLETIITGNALDVDVLEELEELLITSDFGVQAAHNIIAETKERFPREAPEGNHKVKKMLKIVIADRLRRHHAALQLVTPGPHALMMVGVNGVGKTTTIGKLSAYYKEQGLDLLLAAGDTFRAAAVEQLQIWGERTQTPVIAQGQNADAASVIYDAYAAAHKRGVDLLIADTAGRLHTKTNLMEELKKVLRVIKKLESTAPHDIWLVLDATTGQNAINQVKIFHEALGLTGLIITKLDGTAKGGVVVGICEQFNLPIRFIGVGEGVEDLRPFDPQEFVEALFAES
ncbi:signal recognition particle-docking protein FtsY [Magnetococcus marinus MC-1]|uniref:Signal recognition particle receptor FtsY n=1 Tax=Magnetococcus marinus (strain ATCC BAA-1437 / JCM 17883 / MC-1) TaxID=156889 RepID=A0L5A1_MAGMM|nr:signal recognition particle-docking protein FtsY [Magnetococcus marinus]ABK43144.1 signal recognition particle-docking protein FtsY [Magnetococcus marinus MC-1]